MAWIGKSLVVATFLGSVAFLGFAIAATVGGPNWAAEMRDLEGKEAHEGFQFNKSEGVPSKWSVKRTGSDAQVGSSFVAGEVVISALKALTADQQKQISELQEATKALEERRDIVVKTIPVDEASMEASRKALLGLITSTRARASELANQVTQKTEEAQKIEQRIGERRDDVIRLKAQLDELRADRFRLDELRTELNDQLQQLISLLDRANERNEQLKSTAVSK